MSSAEKKHDYHLVDPSPWPIFCSFASLIVCFGAVYYFTTKNLWLTFVGLAVLFYGVFMWFREVVIEAGIREITRLLFKSVIVMEWFCLSLQR